MEFTEIVQTLRDTHGEDILSVEPDVGDAWVEVPAELWPEVALSLRDDNRLGFDFLNCVSGVDYLEPDPKKVAKVDWEPHIEVVYHLSSLRLGHRLTLKIIVPRWRDDAAGQLPQVPSVAGVWSTADWHEREVYDLVGVEFTGHPDMRRILCPEDWEGHPLRKDYEMPLEYHGIRGR